MPDYYNLEQLARAAGLSGGETSELLSKGAFRATVKNDRSFYSARQAHLLLAALRLSRKQTVPFEEALRLIHARTSQTKRAFVA